MVVTPYLPYNFFHQTYDLDCASPDDASTPKLRDDGIGQMKGKNFKVFVSKSTKELLNSAVEEGRVFSAHRNGHWEPDAEAEAEAEMCFTVEIFWWSFIVPKYDLMQYPERLVFVGGYIFAMGRSGGGSWECVADVGLF